MAYEKISSFFGRLGRKARELKDRYFGKEHIGAPAGGSDLYKSRFGEVADKTEEILKKVFHYGEKRDRPADAFDYVGVTIPSGKEILHKLYDIGKSYRHAFDMAPETREQFSREYKSFKEFFAVKMNETNPKYQEELAKAYAPRQPRERRAETAAPEAPSTQTAITPAAPVPALVAPVAGGGTATEAPAGGGAHREAREEAGGGERARTRGPRRTFLDIAGDWYGDHIDRYPKRTYDAGIAFLDNVDSETVIGSFEALSDAWHSYLIRRAQTRAAMRGGGHPGGPAPVAPAQPAHPAPPAVPAPHPAAGGNGVAGHGGGFQGTAKFVFVNVSPSMRNEQTNHHDAFGGEAGLGGGTEGRGGGYDADLVARLFSESGASYREIARINADLVKEISKSGKVDEDAIARKVEKGLAGKYDAKFKEISGVVKGYGSDMKDAVKILKSYGKDIREIKKYKPAIENIKEKVAKIPQQIREYKAKSPAASGKKKPETRRKAEGGKKSPAGAKKAEGTQPKVRPQEKYRKIAEDEFPKILQKAKESGVTERDLLTDPEKRKAFISDRLKESKIRVGGSGFTYIDTQINIMLVNILSQNVQYGADPALEDLLRSVGDYAKDVGSKSGAMSNASNDLSKKISDYFDRKNRPS